MHKPGFYPDMTDSEYHSLPYPSKSKICKIDPLPANYLVEDDKPSAALIQGAFFSALLFDMDEIANYCVLPGFTRASSDAEPYIEQYGQRYCITIKERDECKLWKEVVENDPECQKILNPGVPVSKELAMIYELDGILCRSKMDIIEWHDEGVVDVTDVKTFRNPLTNRNISSEIYTRKYHVQAAMYALGLRSLGYRLRYWRHLWVEKPKAQIINGQSIGVRVTSLSPDAISLGVTETRRLLADFVKYESEGFFPGYESGEVDLPYYAYNY